MPIFDFECPNCDLPTQERMVNTDEIPNCEYCEAQMQKVYLKPPTWKFGNINRQGKWVGDSAKEFKKFKKDKK